MRRPGVVTCNELKRVPEECTPENFKRLMDLGYMREYSRLIEKCYADSRYVNQLVECYNYIVEEVKKVVIEA